MKGACKYRKHGEVRGEHGKSSVISVEFSVFQ